MQHSATQNPARARTHPHSPRGTPEQRKAVFEFLNDIGIPTVTTASVGKSFLTGVAVRNGTLAVSAAASMDSLLHEAGHLAIVPERFRPWMDGDVSHGQRRMLDAIMDLEPDSPLVRAALHTGDPEATAWAWAAGVHLGLPPEIVVRDRSYEGQGAGVRLALKNGTYLGIHGLCHAGLCVRGMTARLRGEAPYPTLRAWTQPLSEMG